MDADDVPHSEYYEAVGRSITAWQQVESQLTGLFSRLLICAFHGSMMHSTFEHMWIAGNILNSLTNVGTRLDLVDTTFSRLVKDDALVAEWTSTKNKIRDNYKRRNALAHGTAWGNEHGISWLGSPMFSSRDQRYTPKQVQEWEASFKALADRVETLAIAVNKHLVAHPLPIIAR